MTPFIQHIEVISSKKTAQEISNHLAARIAIDLGCSVQEITPQLNVENFNSIGMGIIVPHVNTAFASQMTIYGLKLKKPLLTDHIIDENPIHFIFCLVGNTQKFPEFLSEISRFCRIFKQKNIAQKLLGCETEESLYAFLMELDGQASISANQSTSISI